jgi:arginine:ornithine antiporter / lysine permease
MIQLFLLLTLQSKASYLALISLSTAMILVPYLFSAIYGVVVATRGEGESGRPGPGSTGDKSIAALAAVYCLWLLYAAGLKYLLLSALLYAPGAALYIWAKRERAEPVFTGRERVMLGLSLLLAALAAFLLASGRLAL